MAAVSLTTIPKPAIRSDWLAARHGYYNASDAGCLYGVHPHRNLADVAIDKLADSPGDAEPTEAMERGNRLEPFLLEWFGDRHGVKVLVPDRLFVAGRIMATIDGEIPGNDLAWIEAKTTAYRWDEVPEHVYWQVVAQGAASGRRKCHVVWIDADMRFKEQTIGVPEEHVADFVERAERFMDFIALGMVPEGLEMTAAQVVQMFPIPAQGKLAAVDDDQLLAVIEWEQCRSARLTAEKLEEAAKDRVAMMFEDAEGLTHDGRLVATWKANRPSVKPDWRALEADQPDLVAQYRRETPGARVMRAKKELGA